jgi:hypothetical protein
MQFDQQRSELRLSENADWGLVESTAHQLVSDFRATITEKLDRIDQRYWDMKIGDVTVTLHLEHYLGISIFPAKGFENDPLAKGLIESINEKYA